MTNSEISKRFTLHDLFGSLFPGMLTLIGIGSFAILNKYDEWSDLKVLTDSFRTLHLTVQIFITLVTSYASGLLCLEIGRFVYKLCERYFPSFSDNTKNPADPASKTIAPLTNDHKHLLSNSVKNEFETRMTKVFPGAKLEAEAERTFLAYAQLMSAGKDQFVQLMSGRAAMYCGLAGATLLIFLGAVITFLFSNGRQVDPGKSIAFFTVLAVMCYASLRRVHTFECWWKIHVIFGFLALERSAPRKPDETE